ncbi:hypothetical protein Taro_056821 [Colocasia esculenta]|uniref:Uncharacterized protein n=1 Tax=Colocasia esculenta TaxID=4460 RepID=A0A843XXA4_COLES|nr:hypothetical protein [Colocasia esculenta]
MGPKLPSGVCVLVHRLPYPPAGRGYLFAPGSEPPAWPQFRIGTSTRSVNGRIRRFPVRRPNSTSGARSRAADLIAYGHRVAQTGITFRSVIGIAYKTQIRNRHSELLDGPLLPQVIRRRFGVEKPSFRTPKLRFEPTISPIPSSDSVDYVNRWRSPHAEPPSHSDRKSSDSVDYANRWRSPHAEPPSHSDRKSCSTRREISSRGRGYGCPNIADIVTPFGLFPPLQRMNWA